MADSLLIKDVMIPTVQLEPNARAGDALQKLDHNNLEYGVVRDESGTLFTAVTREQLNNVDIDEPIRSLTSRVLHPIPIEADDTIDRIVQTRADDFRFNPDLIGIVVQNRGKIRGILLRERIESFPGLFLSDPRLRGDIAMMPKIMLFECPGCHRQMPINWGDYDPDDPPTCSDRHPKCVMTRIQ